MLQRNLNNAKPVVCNCAPRRIAMRLAGHLGMTPAIVLAVLPKCPLCLGAWLGFLGVFGANSWVNAAAGTPLWTILASMTLTIIAWRARRSGGWRPVIAGVLGSSVLIAGKHYAEIVLVVIGLSMLMGAFLWSSLPPSQGVGLPSLQWRIEAFRRTK